MRVNILIGVAISLFFIACEKDNKDLDREDYVKINDREFCINYPIISSDIDKVERYLNEKSIAFEKKINGNITVIESYIGKSKNDLIQKVIFMFKYKDDYIDFFNVSFTYNEELNEQDKEKLIALMNANYFN